MRQMWAVLGALVVLMAIVPLAFQALQFRQE